MAGYRGTIGVLGHIGTLLYYFSLSYSRDCDTGR